MKTTKLPELNYRLFKCREHPTFIKAIPYSANLIADTPNLKIHVGTDSQNEGSKTWYATVIAYRYENNGVHYIYNLISVPRVRDNWQRLWLEIERSRELAEYLTLNSSMQVYQVDIDYNDDEDEWSNRLISAGKGLFDGLGYRVGVKPSQLIATRAADHIVKNIKIYNK